MTHIRRFIKLLSSGLKRRGSDRGFTLIEVVIAAMILLVAMAGFVPFFLSGLSQASSVRYKSIATNIAREHVEQIRQLDYREISGYSDTEYYQRGEGSTSLPFGVVCAVTEDTVSKLKKVTVTVDWTGPPKVSAASITTLVYQQFLGPRGAFLEVAPTVFDPQGSPFRTITGSRPTPKTVTVRYHIAESDWGFVYGDLNQPSMAKIPGVYMRLYFVDDHGIKLPVGEAENDYKISNAFIPAPTVDANGKVDDIWFEYSFDASTIPDGYWEIQATAYNSRNEPGNTWRLRVRVEMGPPGPPTPLIATPQADNQTIELTWTGGAERDRHHYVLTRYSNRSDGTASTWTTELLPTESGFIDQGSVASQLDPWGEDPSSPNIYVYELWAVDISGQEGEAVQAQTQLPPLATTTTTTDAAPPPPTSSTSTSTTLGGYSCSIENTLYETWNIIVKDENDNTVYLGSLGVSASLTVPGLATGKFSITATASGKPSVNATFKMPADNRKIVLVLR